jgi:hypothetical protein
LARLENSHTHAPRDQTCNQSPSMGPKCEAWAARSVGWNP